MTQNAFQFLGAFLAQIFRLFTSWYLPGTNVTPAGALFFVAASILALRFIKALFLRYTSSNDVKGGSDE